MQNDENRHFIEYPKIYGFKTPVKHLFDPPDHWKRVFDRIEFGEESVTQETDENPYQ